MPPVDWTNNLLRGGQDENGFQESFGHLLVAHFSSLLLPSELCFSSTLFTPGALLETVAVSGKSGGGPGPGDWRSEGTVAIEGV